MLLTEGIVANDYLEAVTHEDISLIHQLLLRHCAQHQKSYFQILKHLDSFLNLSALEICVFMQKALMGVFIIVEIKVA